MDYSKVLDEKTGTITFPPEWRDDPDGDWLKWVEPEMRKKGGNPSQFMASALLRMPADHPQREEVQRVYDNIVNLQKQKLKEHLKKTTLSAQQYGMTLTITGLAQQKDLNGQKVVLEEWVKDKERWRCKLPNGEYVGVRPKNLA